MKPLLACLVLLLACCLPARSQMLFPIVNGGSVSSPPPSYVGVCDTDGSGCALAYSTTHSAVGSYGGNLFELINPTPVWTGTGYISGTTFTVSSTVSGALATGVALSAPGSTTTPVLLPITYIVSGSGPYTVSQSQTAGSSGSPLTMAAYSVLDIGQTNHLPNLSGIPAFCKGITCLVERVFNEGTATNADLYASNNNNGGSTYRANCTASIVACAPLFWLDTKINVWMVAASYPAGLELCAGANPTLCGTSGLPTGSVSRSLMTVERPDMFTDSGANVDQAELGATTSGSMFGIIPNLYTSSFGCTAGFWCVGFDYEGFSTLGEGAANGPSQRNIYEARYLSSGPTSTFLINNSSILSGTPPVTLNTGPQFHVGLEGDRSTSPVYLYDALLFPDGNSHTAAYNNLAAWYAPQTATPTAGPLDVAFYVNPGFPDASSGYKSALVGNAYAGYSPRSLQASYTGPIADLNNGSTTETFSAVSGVLDPAAATFCSGGCTVRGLYGQAPWAPNGGNVGNAYDPLLKLTCASGPTSCPTVTFSSLNAQPTLHFSGGQCLLSGTMSGYVGHVLKAFEIGAVMRRTSGTTYGAGIAWGANSYYFVGAGNSANTAAFSNGQAFGSGAATDNDWHSIIGDTTTGSTGTLYVDGISVGTASTNAGETLQNYVTLGCTWTGSAIANALTGDIAEAWLQVRVSDAAGDLTSYVTPVFANQEAFWGPLPNPVGVVNTETFRNVGASATPGGSGAAFPVNVFSNTKPGAVPAGYIAVPSVAGTPVPYTAYDCARTWPDGSQRGCAYAMFLPQLASGAEEQVTWTATPGSYVTTSSVTPATVAAISDFKIVASGVNKTWINYQGVPTGTQLGFSASGGVVTSGAVRISPQVGTGVFGSNCSNSGGTCLNPTNYSYTTASAPTTPYTTLHLTGSVANAVSQNGRLMVYDITTPSAIPAGTTATASGTTVNLSAAASAVGMGDTIAFAYPVQGCSTTPAGYTVTQTGNFVASVNVINGGAGCATVGSGNQTFDANLYLNAYGSIKPPTTATAGGAASFTGSYSAGTLTVSAVTGIVSKGQLVRDSTGALAVIIGGASSSWTVSAALTNGAMTANCPVQIYADGDHMTGFKVFGPFVDNGTGAQDSWHRATAYIEYWHQGGATDSVRAIAMVDDTIYTPGQSAPSYTYDADMKNGTAEIRGNAAGPGPYTRLTLNTSGAWYTGDPALSGPVGASGRPDWLGTTPNAFSESFSLGINSVIVALTTSDKVYWHANRAHMPLTDSVIPTPTVIPNSGTYGSPNTYIGYYQPYGVPFIDTQGGWTGGGEHFFLAPDSAHLAFWYLSADIAADRGASWLQQTRVAGIQLLGAQQGPRWDDTWHSVDVDPSWSQPAANTDPPYLFANVRTGYDARSFGQGGQSSLSNAAQVGPGDATHWPVGLPAAIYTVEGDRFMLDNIDLNASNMLMGQFDDFNRTANFAGTQWYALYYGEATGNVRATGWASVGISDAAIYLPPAEPDSQWWLHVVTNNVAAQAALVPYTGTVGRGCNGSTSCTSQGATGTKSYDTSVMGTTVSPISWTNYGGLVNTAFSPFEEGYVAEATDKLAMQWNGALSNLTTVYGYEISTNFVGNAAANACAYNISSYDLTWGSTVTGQPFTGWDATDIGTPQRGNFDYLANNADINTIAGSSEVYANSQPGVSIGALKFTAATTGPGSAVIVSGSASAALPHAIISDITTPSAIPVGTYVTGTPSGSSIPISNSISGITAGDIIGVSQVLDYPNNSNVIRPAGSLAMFTNIDYQNETTPNAATIGTFPPPATPSVDDRHFLVWCPDSSGAAKGTLNPAGTNCASPSPITFSANGRYRMHWIANQTCPPVTDGTWNGQDYQSYQGRLAQFWAIARGANALAPTSNTALAISHTTPSVSPLNTTFSPQPRIAWDDHF